MNEAFMPMSLKSIHYEDKAIFFDNALLKKKTDYFLFKKLENQKLYVTFALP
jgi:hypothetical protein